MPAHRPLTALLPFSETILLTPDHELAPPSPHHPNIPSYPSSALAPTVSSHALTRSYNLTSIPHPYRAVPCSHEAHPVQTAPFLIDHSLRTGRERSLSPAKPPNLLVQARHTVPPPFPPCPLLKQRKTTADTPCNKSQPIHLSTYPPPFVDTRMHTHSALRRRFCRRFGLGGCFAWVEYSGLSLFVELVTALIRWFTCARAKFEQLILSEEEEEEEALQA